MKQINLAPLKEVDEEFKGITEAIDAAYKGEWDDKIHDSFRRYVRQMQDQGREIHIIERKAKEIEEEINKLSIENMTSKVGNLCREAESV